MCVSRDDLVINNHRSRGKQDCGRFSHLVFGQAPQGSPVPGVGSHVFHNIPAEPHVHAHAPVMPAEEEMPQMEPAMPAEQDMESVKSEPMSTEEYLRFATVREHCTYSR